MFWLKPELLNILFILVTEDVSQSPMSWLKLMAEKNISLISVTLLVSQAPMSWLKFSVMYKSSNSWLILLNELSVTSHVVTSPVVQASIWVLVTFVPEPVIVL